MKLLKALVISFSMYSGIPMPQFEWKEEDMKYILCFFPWIGAVIGLGIVLWSMLCKQAELGMLCYTMGGAAIPLLITGGFHVDGFMDTMDAFHSYQPKEKKLEILKDSHIGAFSVIMLALYGLIYLGAFSEIKKESGLWIVCAGFALSRVLSGIAVVTFHSAKSDGLLYLFASRAQKRIVKASLYVQGILCIAFMLWQSPLPGGAAVLAALLIFAYYHHQTKKELGGITGDTAGWFVLLCEEVVMVVVAVVGKLI